jgi:hypothetical protein
MSTRARWFTSLALAALASLVLTVSPSTAQHKTIRLPCGVLVDATHPWHSSVPGGRVQTGDHWITARNAHTPAGSCAFVRTMVHRLLALPERTYAGRDGGRLFGGLCTWETGSRGEQVQPFHVILCVLAARTRDRRSKFTIDVEAYVDPDPRFITR